MFLKIPHFLGTNFSTCDLQTVDHTSVPLALKGIFLNIFLKFFYNLVDSFQDTQEEFLDPFNGANPRPFRARTKNAAHAFSKDDTREQG